MTLQKKKRLWKLTPPFLMIPTTGIQAADIISKSPESKTDGKFHHVIYSQHFNSDFLSTVGQNQSVSYRISISSTVEAQDFHKRNDHPTHRRDRGGTMFCLQNTSHDLNIWSRQFLSKTRRAGNEASSKVETSATTVSWLRCTE